MSTTSGATPVAQIAEYFTRADFALALLIALAGSILYLRRRSYDGLDWAVLVAGLVYLVVGLTSNILGWRGLQLAGILLAVGFGSALFFVQRSSSHRTILIGGIFVLVLMSVAIPIRSNSDNYNYQDVQTSYASNFTIHYSQPSQSLYFVPFQVYAIFLAHNIVTDRPLLFETEVSPYYSPTFSQSYNYVLTAPETCVDLTSSNQGGICHMSNSSDILYQNSRNSLEYFPRE